MAWVLWTYQNIANTGPYSAYWCKIAGVEGIWDAGSVSVENILMLNEGVGVQFRFFGGSPIPTQLSIACGLSCHSGPTVNYTDIDYAFGVVSGAGVPMQLGVYEKGVLKISLGGYYITNELAIQINAAGRVEYKKDGVVVYTSDVLPLAPLYAHMAFRFRATTIGTRMYLAYYHYIDTVGIPVVKIDHLTLMGVH